MQTAGKMTTASINGMSLSFPERSMGETHFQSQVAAEHWLNLGGKDYRLVGRTIRIGRAPDNDIVIDHKSCSRYHAMITIEHERIVIEDLKSRNGVFVNGSQIKRSELRENQEVRVGDVMGVFFQRKKASSGAKQIRVSVLQQILNHQAVAGVVEKFSSMDARRKKVLVGVATLILISIWLFTGGRNGTQTDHESAPLQATVVDLTPAQKSTLESCIEAEDLGNFRQASACLKALPQTSEVQMALERTERRQADLSEKRFKEGQQAFENYYYDIAILKWQEVLLISDDASQYRTQAIAGIAQAQEKRRQR